MYQVTIFPKCQPLTSKNICTVEFGCSTCAFPLHAGKRWWDPQARLLAVQSG